MNRKDIYNAIDAERLSQDMRWRTGRANEGQYQFAAPHILLIEENADKLRKLWYGATKENITERLIKLAAITVRALEEISPDTAPSQGRNPA